MRSEFSDAIGQAPPNPPPPYSRSDGVEQAVAGLQFEDIAGSFLHLRAIERAVQIISEAAKELPNEWRDRYPMAGWSPIIRIGNLLRHEYYRTNPRDMWEIATVHLPRLRPIVERMLREDTRPPEAGESRA